MRISVIVVFLLAGILLLLIAGSSLFTVDPSEYVYVTQFGRHVATYDGGENNTDAGLHIKWPWPIQTIQRIDRRLQQYDLPPTELLTRAADDKTIDKTLIGEAYVCWRIAGKEGADLFIRRLGTQDRVRTILKDRITGALAELVGNMPMTDLIAADLVLPRNYGAAQLVASTGSPLTKLLWCAPDSWAQPDDSGKPKKVEANMARLHRDLLTRFQDTVRRDYGIDIVDIRIRRLNHPLQVRESIFSRIRTERDNRIAHHTNEGKREAERILSDAAEAVSQINAEAEKDKRQREGTAKAEADQIRGQAQKKDEEFYAFLKELEANKKILGDGKTTILLSTHHPFFNRLFQSSSPQNRGTLTNPPTPSPGLLPQQPGREGGEREPAPAEPARKGGQ